MPDSDSWPYASVRGLTLFSLICYASFTCAQTLPAKNQSQPIARKTVAAEVPAAKLTPEQERGLRLLKAAEAEAAGLAPDMKAFVLWRASYAYAKRDPTKAERLALDAFTATLSIEAPANDDYCRASGSAGDIQTTIQQRVLSSMIEKQKINEVEQLLPQATEWVRNQITSLLVTHYIKEKDSEKAEALLTQVADSKNYPYGAAADLILAMGPELSGNRMTVFHQALDNYEQHQKDLGVGTGDIGDLVGRTWSAVPPAMVLESVDKLLDEAKSAESKLHYAMTTDSGSLTLNSRYEYRLFQLLPVLQELDKDKAEQLLRDNAETKARLAKYPKGMQSLAGKGAVYSMSVMDSEPPPEQMKQEQVTAQVQERKTKIMKEAEKDPAQALNDALSMPVQIQNGVWSPRVATLLEFAQYTLQRKPSLAKSALDEILKVQEQLSPTEVSMSRVSSIPKMYLDLGDEDAARKAVKALLKTAERSYASDTNADDPNKGFKATWPSADLWRKCVQASAQISPALAEEIIAEIPDSDIAAAQKVAFGSSLLGVVGEPVLVGECHKGGSSFSFSE